MIQPTHPEPIPTAQEDISLRQPVGGDRNQTIGQVLGGMVVYGSGGQAIINASGENQETTEKPALSTIGANPYKGLTAFQETEGDRPIREINDDRPKD